MTDTPTRTSPRLLVWWERLPIAVQVGVVLPVSVAAMWMLHVTVLNQPTSRGFGYGLFWGVIVAFVIVGATRAERAKREAAQRAAPEDSDPPGRLKL